MAGREVRVISQADIDRRMPALLAAFGDPTNTTVVIGCRNVDTSKLPRGPGIPPIPEPSIVHSIVDCELCGEKVWIGPKQKQEKGTRTCYICLAILAKYNAYPLAVRSLDPEHDKIPRRR